MSHAILFRLGAVDGMPHGMSANDNIYPPLDHSLDSRDLAWCCPQHPTLAETWLAFLQHCWRRVQRGVLAYDTVRRYADLREQLDELGARPIHELRSSEANAWHERIGERKSQRTSKPMHRTADACRDLLAQICDFAEVQDWRQPNTNPVRVVPRYGSSPRDIHLSEEELRRIFQALRAVEDRRARRRYTSPLRQAAAYSPTQIILAMFLWQRRPKELQRLQWNQLEGLDGARPLARRVRMKRGVRSLAIPHAVQRLLLAQRERVGTLSPYVFPSSLGKPIVTVWHVWCEILTVAGMDHLPLYGLRHTGATHLIEEGFTHAETAIHLGNTEGVVRRHYDHAAVSPHEEAVVLRAGATLARIGGVL